MALTDNLISFWELEEASGVRIDALGLNNLTPTNNPANATGKVGSAVDFEASNTQYLSIADNPSLRTGDIDFTFMAWFKGETFTSFPVIANKAWATAGITRGWVCYIDTTGGQPKATFAVAASDGTQLDLGWPAVLSAGSTWYLVFGWHDSVNNQIGISINAGTAITAAYSKGVADGSGDFVLGASVPQTLWFDGIVDQVGFWKRVLTPAERTELYNGGAGLSYAAMGGAPVGSAYWNALTGLSGYTGGGRIGYVH